jgi:hypothetical protein
VLKLGLKKVSQIYKYIVVTQTFVFKKKTIFIDFLPTFNIHLLPFIHEKTPHRSTDFSGKH